VLDAIAAAGLRTARVDDGRVFGQAGR